MPDISVEDAVKRNCEALISGNIAQLFVDLTPEAMVKMSQAQAQAQAAGGAGAGMGAMPKLTGYEVVSRDREGEDELYDVRFAGDVNFGVKARWRQVADQWKLADFEPYQYETPEGSITEPEGGATSS